jgi:predicted RNase H-like nuclease
MEVQRSLHGWGGGQRVRNVDRPLFHNKDIQQHMKEKEPEIILLTYLLT